MFDNNNRNKTFLKLCCEVEGGSYSFILFLYFGKFKKKRKREKNHRNDIRDERYRGADEFSFGGRP